MHSSLPGFIVCLFVTLKPSSLSLCGQEHNECFEKNLYVSLYIYIISRHYFILFYFIVFVVLCMHGNHWILCWFIDPSVINTVQTFKAYYYWRGYWFLFSWGDLCGVTCGVIIHSIVCMINDWYEDSIVAGFSLLQCRIFHKTITRSPYIFTLFFLLVS